jgi:hypothetical protein
MFGSRESPVVLHRQGDSISVTLEPGEAIVLQVSAQPAPLPKGSSPN